MTNTDTLLGIDLGTSGCKATLIGLDGTVRGEGYEEYATSHPQPGFAEQNPQDWLAAVRRALDTVAAQSGGWQGLRAVALDGSTHNAVLLDAAEQVVRPVIMWTDQRSVVECRWLQEHHGEQVFATAYQRPTPTWTLPQMRWLATHEPDALQRTRHILFGKDFLRWKLTGRMATDHIEAQGSLFYDMRQRCWSKELCALGGVPYDALPELVEPTDVTGAVTAAGAAWTGLPAGIAVVAGASDSAIEDYAAGAIEPGQCIVKLATAGNVNVMTDAPHPNAQTLTYSHVVPGLWYTVVATNTAASAKRWFRDLFCAGEVEEAKRCGANVFQLIDNLAAESPLGADGLLFHPYLLGERSPYWDPDLRASFVGVRMSHRKGDFVRALMEGVAFSLRDCFRVLEGMGLPVTEIRLIGGGAKSAIWSRIVCDVFGRRLLRPALCDASFGAALLAGVGVGIFPDPRAAVTRCLQIADAIEPDLGTHAKYAELFENYVKVHDALAPVYQAMSRAGRKEG